MVLWVFGYASLLWKPGFQYDDKMLGFIKGYRRAFHLACYEHRGTPEFPARVATLEPHHPNAICWGVAYCIKDADAAERALQYLALRESEYDYKCTLQFFTEESPNDPVISDVLVFMSTLDKESNKYYLGPAPKDTMAMQIAIAKGPSGPNCDYLFWLVEALRKIGHEDEEILELSHAVRKVQYELQNNLNSTVRVGEVTNGLSHASLPIANFSQMSPTTLLKSQAL